MRKRRQSQLPLSRRLLHEARKISRQLSLLLSLAGMVTLALISLGQPWMHFQVPLTPPGDPAGPRTIPINTILSVRCTDISCLQEHDYKACKACPGRAVPGTHFSSVPGPPSALPGMILTALGWSSLPCAHPHPHDTHPGVSAALPSPDLLDLAWISLLIASITGSCLCLILINLIFFSSSNFPILDFSSIIISVLTGMALRSFC